MRGHGGHTGTGTRFDLRAPPYHGDDRDQLYTPHRDDGYDPEGYCFRKEGNSSVKLSLIQARMTTRTKDNQSESTYETSKSMLLELQYQTKTQQADRTPIGISAGQSPQTNFKLIKNYTDSESKGSPQYTLEVKPTNQKIQSDQNMNQECTNQTRPTHVQMLQQRQELAAARRNFSPFGDFRQVLMPKKKELVFLPPPEFFKKKKVMKNLSLAQWKSQSVLKCVPAKTDKVEDQKYEELDDFTSLLTKRLFENLEDVKVGNGSYTVKEGSYCLVIQQEKHDKKKEDLNARDLERKNKHFEEMLPGPCFGLSKLENAKPSSFNRDEILKFETMYKDVLYDTRIRVGRFYQAFVPDCKPTRAFRKSTVIFGLPPKDSEEIKPPKLTIEYKQRGRRDKEKMAQETTSNAMNQEKMPDDSDLKDEHTAGSYFQNDEFSGNLITENIYTPIRNLNEYIEWDPALAKDSEVEDMIGQVLEDFKNDPRISYEMILDYLKICRLNKDRFLDHLEMDHDDFRKYLYMVLHKAA